MNLQPYDFEKSILKLVEFIRIFEKKMQKHYCIPHLPYTKVGEDFPKKGSIKKEDSLIQYNYHGGGCTVHLDDIILDYNVVLSDTNYIKLSSWKFGQFIESWYKKKIDIYTIGEGMEKLSKKGVLNRLPTGLAYYEVNMSVLLAGK